MVQGILEVAAVCVGLVGLMGAAAATGMPMWKVTAFIGENIIVMETRWEGLWMNCYRQANIRMQCKVYDSLLFLPPDLQAARGLMCCSLALSGLGLLVSLAGLRCTSCVRDNDRAKTLLLMVAGGMQITASVCVLIPVSWTGHVIIRDFYNPLLIDAQRRELGEALYVGWMTGGILFASGVLFICRRVTSEKYSFDVYHPYNMPVQTHIPNTATLMRYHPVSSVRSIGATAPPPALQNGMGFAAQPWLRSVTGLPLQSGAAPVNPAAVYYPGRVGHVPLLHRSSIGLHPSSTRSSHFVGSLSSAPDSLYMSQPPAPSSVSYAGIPSVSYTSSFQPLPQDPVFFSYNESRVEPNPYHGSRSGVYI